jgi:hypothetical protein
MELAPLYDKSKNGKIKTWQIETRKNVIVIKHGYEKGKITKSERRITRGKNIGKSNETTPITQAQLEARSKWQRKLDKGWVQKKSLVNAKVSYFPMLAKTYYHVNSPDVLAGKKKITPLPKNVILQPKLNGVRCIAVKSNNCVSLYSRNMKDLTVVNYSLAQELNLIMVDGDIWDGELYKHGWPFQRIISAVKKETLDTHFLQFWRFDIPSYKEIMTIRYLMMSFGNINNRRIFQLDGVCLANPMHIDIQRQHDVWIKEGYEGIIIRDGNSNYLWKHRGKELLKYKEFIDEEFRIVGYKHGSGTHQGAICFKCRTKPKNWKQYKYPHYNYFDVNIALPIQDRISMYREGWRYVGRMLTVRYQERSVDLVPIFPIGISIRDYE